jgi:hypothetical protein
MATRPRSLLARLVPAALAALAALLAVPTPAGAQQAPGGSEQFTIAPTSGPVGTSITVTGTGWTPNTAVQAGITEDARLIGGRVGSPAGPISEVVTDARGAFTVQVEAVPIPPEMLFANDATVWAMYADLSRGGSATFHYEGPGLPPMPSGLTAVPSDPRAIRLTWEDNSTDETGFVITDGIEERSVPANRTTYVWSGLAPGTERCFEIQAVNALGRSLVFPPPPPSGVCTTTPAP